MKHTLHGKSAEFSYVYVCCRSIMFNMKDENNPDFRRRVLLGEIKPEAIPAMNISDMASDQRKKENDDIKAKALFECERGLKQLASTDQFKCHKCGQRKTTYFQMQTRSADEPMTTFVTCVNCNAHWKFCWFFLLLVLLHHPPSFITNGIEVGATDKLEVNFKLG